MQNLSTGIHRQHAAPLYLEGNDCLISATVAVSHIANLDAGSLATYAHPDMRDTTVGMVSATPMPALAKSIEHRFKQHLTNVYGLGRQEVLQPDECSAELLWCNGAEFHDDTCFDCILAILMCAGPTRDLVLPHLEVVVTMTPGTVVLIDCAQPHGLLLPGKQLFDSKEYPANGPLSVLCTMELPRDVKGLQSLMGYALNPITIPVSAVYLKDDSRVNAYTGAIE